MKKTDETIEVYVLRYALSDGAVKVRAEKTQYEYYRPIDGQMYSWMSFSEKDIAHTEAEAMEKAEAMRAKKIANLQKQIAKLENLQIKIK